MIGREGCVPIIEITDENFQSMWPGIKKSIEGASFIAIDCELSGLGDRSKLNYPEVDIRYENTAKIAQEYSIVSLGLSCYNCLNVSSVDVNCNNGKQHIRSQNYCVQTYNILTLSVNPYTVEARSLKFLAAHGFDFNKQYSHGLEYDLPFKKQKQDGKARVGDIFTTIIKKKKPIVLHNGYIDLVYLYHSFYAELPKKSDSFAADLNEMFPSGIYDTKYITEFHETFPATFLEYIFKKMQLENDSRSKKGLWHIRLNFPPYPDALYDLNWHPFNQVHDQSNLNSENLPTLCNSYKFHGWCSQGENCNSSHDINRIVRELDSGRKRRFNPRIADTSVAHIIHLKKQNLNKEPSSKRVRIRKSHGGNSDCGSNDSVSCSGESLPFDSDDDVNHCTKNYDDLLNDDEKNSHTNGKSSPLNISLNDNSILLNESDNGILIPEIKTKNKIQAHCSGHRAGFDAFMTGYIFACSVTKHGSLSDPNDFADPNAIKLNHLVSRVYLIGKEFPFLIRSSSYSKTSNAHDFILNRLRHSKDIEENKDQEQ